MGKLIVAKNLFFSLSCGFERKLRGENSLPCHFIPINYSFLLLTLLPPFFFPFYVSHLGVTLQFDSFFTFNLVRKKIQPHFFEPRLIDLSFQWCFFSSTYLNNRNIGQLIKY